MEAIETQPSTSTDKASEEPTAAEIIITQQQFKELEEKLGKAENELNQLRHENRKLKERLAESERQKESMSARLFCVDRFTADADISFYTGLPNYSTFMAIFDYLNPGDNCENIRPRSNVTDVPEDFYNSDSDEDDDVHKAKKGRRRKLKTLDEFFYCLVPFKKRLP